jgi:uncharacterized membrane protein YciS (DUF1049 family)
MMGFAIGCVLVITFYIGKILVDIKEMKYEIKLLRNAIFELQKQKEKED